MSFYSFSYFIRNFNFKLGASLHFLAKFEVDLVRRHSRVVCMCGKFVVSLTQAGEIILSA
jgi:hypothetical protein